MATKEERRSDGAAYLASFIVGGTTTVHVAAGDIGASSTAAVINAANPASFTPMDSGVSGALRNACSPDVVTGKDKMMWPDEGDDAYTSRRVEPHHAGAQASGGRLAAQADLARWLPHCNEYSTRGALEALEAYAAARRDGRILCWDVRNTCTVLGAYERAAPTNQRIGFDVTSDGGALITASADGRVLAFDAGG